MIPSSFKVQTNPPPLNEPVAGSESGSLLVELQKKISERSADNGADLDSRSMMQNRTASLDSLEKKNFTQAAGVDDSERSLLMRTASMGGLDHKTSGYVASLSSGYKSLDQTSSEANLVASSEYKTLNRSTSGDSQDNKTLDQAMGAESIVTKQSADDSSTTRSAFVSRSEGPVVSSKPPKPPKPPRRIIQETSEDQPRVRKRDRLKGAVGEVLGLFLAGIN